LKSKKINKYLELLKSENEKLLKFLKAKFPMFHNSNFFFRDLQYGIRSFLEKKDIDVSYHQAGMLAAEVSNELVDKGIFVKINDQSWKLNYPEFTTKTPGDPL
jgi:hypothetical protein